MHTHVEAPPPARSELQVAELIAILRRHVRMLVGWCAAGVAIGLAMWLWLPREYEADALVRIGEVGQAGVGTPPMMIETANNAAARMRLDAFADEVLQALGVGVEDSAKGRLFRRSLAVSNVKDTNLLEVSVRGYSREEARRSMWQVVTTLAKAHEQIASPSVTRLQAERERVVREIAELERERTLLIGNVNERRSLAPGTRFSENMVYIGMLGQKDAELRQLNAQRLQYEEQLNPARTFSTSTINGIYVQPRHVFPKGSVVIGGGALAGLVLGLGLLLLRVSMGRG